MPYDTRCSLLQWRLLPVLLSNIMQLHLDDTRWNCRPASWLASAALHPKQVDERRRWDVWSLCPWRRSYWHLLEIQVCSRCCHDNKSHAVARKPCDAACILLHTVTLWLSFASDYEMLKATFFNAPPVLLAKISELSLPSKSMMLGSAKCTHPRLTDSEIIFEVFQPMWSRYCSVTDRETDNLP